MDQHAGFLLAAIVGGATQILVRGWALSLSSGKSFFQLQQPQALAAAQPQLSRSQPAACG